MLLTTVLPGNLSHPPTVPYAEEARDGDKPDPDDQGLVALLRTLLLVKLMLVQISVMSPITPYTLKNY